MKAVWMSLMAGALVAVPLAGALASPLPGNLLVAQADDDDDDADEAAPAAGGAAEPAAPIDAAPSPMAPAEAPMAGMPASALNAEQLGLSPLSKSSQDIPELVLGTESQDFAVNRRHFVLRAGQAYRWKISSAGSLEYKLQAPEFFRNVWFNQIVISDLELHMAGPPAWLEYDAKGTIQVQFNTVRPGNFTWHVEGLDGGQDMKGTITVVP